MVLPSLKDRNGSEKLPPVASAPPIGGRKPVKPSVPRMTLKEQLAAFPAASVAVQVTVLVPIGKLEPEGGTHTKVAPGQLSEATGAGYVTGASGAGLHEAVTLPGQVIRGASPSTTITLKEQLAVLPAPSVAMQFTVFVPFWKKLPPAGLQTMPAVPQLSLAVAENGTRAPHWPGSVPMVIGLGQWGIGATVSLTVTVKLQVAVLSVSDAVQFTVVVPLGKGDPLGGVQVAVNVPAQASLAVTIP